MSVIQISTAVLPILIALLPAALTFWSGRRIARHLDDPALPERLLAARRRNSVVFFLSMGLLIATTVSHLQWALLLLVLARMTASYPLRKVLHHETWSLGAYLSFFVRLMVVLFGGVLLIAVIPMLATLAGRHDWIVAGALGAIAVLWTRSYSAVLRTVLRTKPVDKPTLVARFAELLKQCHLPHVSLEQLDMGGGVFANAVALPSIRRPTVVVTSTLIERFDDDETTAILAHELAHIEYYNRRRLRKSSFVTYSVIAAGVLLSPVMRLMAPQAPHAALWIWPVVMVGALLLRAQHRQKHETESDLRALALTGDGDTLIRALTKLHVLARLPRRWETEFERHATHPSLARRIQAIRHASGTAPASISDAATFTDAGNTMSVTFRDDRLEWNKNAETTHTISYGHLSELRIDARTSGALRLVAIDAGKRRWQIALQPGDIARAQAILDVVDTRLGKAAEPPVVRMVTVRLLAWFAMAMAVLAGQYSMVLAGLLAIVQPAPQLLAAAGAAAVAAAGLAWRDHAVWTSSDSQGWLVIAMFLCGTLLMAVAFANRHDAGRQAAWKGLAVLAACTALGWTVVAFSGHGALDLHRSMLDWPAVTVLSLACAGALAFACPRAVRWASIPVAVTGLVSGFLGSASFVDRFVNDPFVAPAAEVTVSTLTASPLTEFAIEFEPIALWLSPQGGYVALSKEEALDQTTIHAGRAGGPLAEFTADDAVFLDETRLVLVEQQPHTSVLHLVDLGAANRKIWSLRVPLSWAELSVDRSSERWGLLGWNAAGEIAGAEGHLGDDAMEQAQWKSPNSGALETLGVSRGVVLAIETHRTPTPLDFRGASRWMSSVPLPRHVESRLWTLHRQGSAELAASRIDLTCRRNVLMDHPATCASFDGATTRFFGVDPGTQQLTPLASIAGRFVFRRNGDRDWVIGWWDQAPVALRPTTREAIRLPARADQHPSQFAIGESVIAAAFWSSTTWTVRVYPRP